MRLFECFAPKGYAVKDFVSGFVRIPTLGVHRPESYDFGYVEIVELKSFTA